MPLNINYIILKFNTKYIIYGYIFYISIEIQFPSIMKSKSIEKLKDFFFGKLTPGFSDGPEIVYEENRKLRYLPLYTYTLPRCTQYGEKYISARHNTYKLCSSVNGALTLSLQIERSQGAIRLLQLLRT